MRKYVENAHGEILSLLVCLLTPCCSLKKLEAREKNSADVANMQGASPLNKLNSQWEIRLEAISHGAIQYTLGGRIGDTGLRRPINNSGGVPDSLVVGEYYRISDVATGDDFSNVGYDGTFQVFQATATTPNVWTTTKILSLNSLMGQQKSGLRQMGVTGTSGESFKAPVYPFVADASGMVVDYALAENLGGMKISLDGLIAYVAPLTP